MKTATTATTLTPYESQALEALRANTEGCTETGPTGTWASVYLDNAKPHAWAGRTWASVLGSLEKKGLYRVDDGYAFGLVLVDA